MLIGIACGLFWGLMEIALRFGLRSACPEAVMGSILTGLSFFYLAAAHFACRSTIGPLLALATAIVLKIGAAILLGISCAGASVMNPAFAFCLQTITYILLAVPFTKITSHRTLFRGAVGGVAAFGAALLFPLTAPLAGLTVCSAPLSFHYGYVALLAGTMSLPLGAHAGSYLHNMFPEINRKNKIELVFFNLFAAAGTLWISVLAR
jgi:hypothetical protein